MSRAIPLCNWGGLSQCPAHRARTPRLAEEGTIHLLSPLCAQQPGACPGLVTGAAPAGMVRAGTTLTVTVTTTTAITGTGTVTTAITGTGTATTSTAACQGHSQMLPMLPRSAAPAFL